MPKIFVSFRNADVGATAGRLTERLQREFGSSAVFDYRWYQCPGEGVRRTVGDALDQSQIVLAVIGSDWVGTRKGKTRQIDNPEDWVRLEIALALARRREVPGFHVIPVCVDGATVPPAADLPQKMGDLSDLIRVNLSQKTADEFENSIRNLVAEIKRLTGPEIYLMLSPLDPELTGYGSYQGTPAYFWHLYVENGHRTLLENVCVRVLAIERPAAQGGFSSVALSEQFELKWAFESSRRRLKSGKRVRCNLGVLVGDSGWTRFALDIGKAWPYGFRAQGVVDAEQQELRADLQVTADEGAHSDVLTVGIHWDGAWDDDPLTMRDHLRVTEVSRQSWNRSELVFLVKETPTGGFTASALDATIHTEATSLPELHERIRNAVHAHLEGRQAPARVRLRFAREEVLRV